MVTPDGAQCPAVTDRDDAGRAGLWRAWQSGKSGFQIADVDELLREGGSGQRVVNAHDLDELLNAIGKAGVGDQICADARPGAAVAEDAGRLGCGRNTGGRIRIVHTDAGRAAVIKPAAYAFANDPQPHAAEGRWGGQ